MKSLCLSRSINKNFSKKFIKPLDKEKEMCYNKITHKTPVVKICDHTNKNGELSRKTELNKKGANL